MPGAGAGREIVAGEPASGAPVVQPVVEAGQEDAALDEVGSAHPWFASGSMSITQA